MHCPAPRRAPGLPPGPARPRPPGAVVVFACQHDEATAAIEVAVAVIVVSHAPAVHQACKLLRAACQGIQARGFKRVPAFPECRCDGNLVDAPRVSKALLQRAEPTGLMAQLAHEIGQRSEEHTSELQSLMRISYAVFCL